MRTAPAAPSTLMKVGSSASVQATTYLQAAPAAHSKHPSCSTPLHQDSYLLLSLSGWSIYSTVIAGQTPCVTEPAIPLIPDNSTNPPTVTAGLFIMSTSIFALKYALALAPSSQPLTTAVMTGIAVGGSVVISILIFLLFFCYRRRHNRHLQEDLNFQDASGPPSTTTNTATHEKSNGLPLSPRPTTYAPTSPPVIGTTNGTTTPSSLKYRDTMLPEEPPSMWFPMPPGWEPPGRQRPVSAGVPPMSPKELTGDTAMGQEKGLAEESGVGGEEKGSMS